MKIWFRINGLEFCSWFIVYRALHKAFRQIGVDVSDSPFDYPGDGYVELHWADPRFWSWSNRPVTLKAGIALSEHRSIMRPDEAIPNVQKCDLLFCPANSAAQAYYEAPLCCPIEIVPFGVDESLSYFDRNWDSGVFKFLLIGVTQFRKGSWLAVEAFHEEFGDETGVQLTVASFSEMPMFMRLKRDYGGCKNISFLGKAQDVSEYYYSHHVLVSPHLSEGWGLTIPESMATGMPCIISRCSAPREYFRDEFGWWIEMSEQYAPVDACLDGVNGSWRLPDKGSLREKMRYAYEHRNECLRKGEAGSRYVLKNLTWIQSAQKIVDVLEDYL